MRTIRVFGHHVSARMLLLGIWELALLTLAAELGALVRFGGEGGGLSHTVPGIWTSAVVFALFTLLCLHALGLYQPRLREAPRLIALRIVIGFALSVVVMTLIFYLFPSIYLGRGIFALTVGFGFVAVVGSHLTFFSLADNAAVKRRTLIFGAGNNAARLLSRMRRQSDRRMLHLVGYVPLPNQRELITSERRIEPRGSILELARAHHVEEIVVATDERRHALPIEELMACRVAGIEVTDMVTFYECHMGKIQCDLVQPSWFIFQQGFHQTFSRQTIKRLLDVTGAVALLVFTSPLLLAAAVAIRVEDGFSSTIFYRQVRTGLAGRPFHIWKLRSMREDAETAGKPAWAKVGDDRVTRVGSVLRKYRIDELPQLFNVLKGEMSLVGPRPERPEFVAELRQALPYYDLRHQVKPGITGWAQLCYPYGSSQEDALEKLQFDLYYVKNGSIYLDLMILLATAEVVLFRKGAR